MKKILILSNSSSGLYEFRNEIVLDMLKDHEVYLSLPDRDNYFELFEKEGAKMIYTEFERRGMNPLKDLGLYKTYKRIIKEIKPDLVCTYTIKPNIYGGMASSVCRVPYVVNITGLGTAIQGGGILARLLTCMYKIATNKAKCVFFQNEYNRNFMQERGIAKKTARMLPGSGVNLNVHSYKAYPLEENGIKILAVLRVMKDKGIEEFLGLVDELGSEKVKFILAGRYEEETKDQYEPIIKRLESEGKLEYKGFVDDMDVLYSECHFIVHPSYHEGLSNVCLEAAACGRMVIASDVPGCRETLVENKTGYLCKLKDKESLIEAAGKALALSENEREEMGRAGRSFVEKNYSRDIVIERYREWY